MMRDGLKVLRFMVKKKEQRKVCNKEFRGKDDESFLVRRVWDGDNVMFEIVFSSFLMGNPGDRGLVDLTSNIENLFYTLFYKDQ